MKKKLLIYGGGSLISEELIKIYEKKNFEFVIFCRNKENFEKFILKNSFETYKFNIFETDIQNLNQNLEMIAQIKDDLTGIIWVAGYTGDPDDEYLNIAKCKENLEVNMMNPILLINELSKKVIKSQNSFIVIFTSVAGLRGRAKRLIYSASKSGLISYSSGLRQKFNKEGINILTIIPGYMNTKPFNIKTFKFLISEPNEVAKLVYSAVKNKKNVIYINSLWRLIMFVIRLIPEKIYKNLNF
ncbi:SDR family NAD(P)-dependent oxidoreductase [Candidatus Pelagibacter sp.]|nr:SDR family NAD(P)-dependent oxidoreductase [Candidatus Pelagibacter sp.]